MKILIVSDNCELVFIELFIGKYFLEIFLLDMNEWVFFEEMFDRVIKIKIRLFIKFYLKVSMLEEGVVIDYLVVVYDFGYNYVVELEFVIEFRDIYSVE